MRFSTTRLLPVLFAFAVAVPRPVHAQKGALDLAADVLDRWLKGYPVERTELAKTDSKVAELDDKIRKWRDCKSVWEMAGDASNSRLGGFAAKMAIRAKCGATSDDDWVNDRKKILDGPAQAGARTGSFDKVDQYTDLRDRILGYMHGDRSGFTQAGLDLLASRKADLTTATGLSVVNPGTLAVSGGAGGGVPGVWTQDYAWSWVAMSFAMQFSSGATMFEKDYQPGQWTKWELTGSESDFKQVTERAFLGKGDDNTEWWRIKTIMSFKQDGAAKLDTITLEAQLKSNGNQNYKQLVRMRGRLPGDTAAQEMLVPQYMTVIRTGGMFASKPTQQSIDGATVGTESITTPAGTFSAKHVRFGGGGGGMGAGGTLDWWLADDAPGGWVKFTVGVGDKTAILDQLVDKGTGAKSELGVKVQ